MDISVPLPAGGEAQYTPDVRRSKRNRGAQLTNAQVCSATPVRAGFTEMVPTRLVAEKGAQEAAQGLGSQGSTGAHAARGTGEW